ncbi:MAG TPA: glycosyltransferase family A protein [Acidimicrobiales bacterium]|nr:glycosyltransferase family A protein [Acidimicrobiales bacterium]
MSSARIMVEVVRWGVAWWLLWKLPRVGPGVATTKRTVVVVPARDEAENLARLLPSIAGADVIVVDDGSTDATAAVAAAHGAEVVIAASPPEGWTGKTNACALGARAATADRFVFMDADVVAEPDGIERILAEHDRTGGLVSVQPWHAVERPYEHLNAFFNLLAPMAVDAFTPLGRRRRATGAFGPCLVLDRDLYERSGGHGGPTVRGAVLDDVALARAVQAAGGEVHLFGGRGALGFRMYPEGVAQLVEGWTKNFAGGAAGTRPTTSVLVLLWISGLIAAPFAPRPAAFVLYAAYAAQLTILLRRVGRFSMSTAAVYPVPLAFFIGVFLRSAILTFVRHEVRWRGRTIRT